MAQTAVMRIKDDGENPWLTAFSRCRIVSG